MTRRCNPKRRRSAPWIKAAILLAVSLPAAASAQDAPAVPVDQDTPEAHLRRGLAHYAAGNYTGAKIEFVTNSGICETTPGVNQYSGYLSVGTNMNM